MRRFLGWSVAAFGLAILALSVWWLGTSSEPLAEESAERGFVLPVTLAEVEVRDVRPLAQLTGTVRAARRAQLGFDASGLLAAIEVREADRVEAGQVLAQLDRRDAELEIAAAEAAASLAEREHELLLAGEREEEKRRLKAVLEATRAEAELARLEVERGEKLIVDRIISQSELDQRVAAHRAADRRRVAAEESHARALAGTRLEDLAIASARVDEARTRVALARHELEKTELRAPWTGHVVRRLVSTGDYVSEGEAVFELVDLSNLEVHLEIPGRFAARLDSGADVRLLLGREGELVVAGRLDATIPAADEAARSFRGIVRLAEGMNPDGILKPGMYVGAELFLESEDDALAVPSDCILASERGRYLVRAVAGEKSAGGPPGGPPSLVAEFVPVRVLAEAEGFSAVASVGPPLAVGDRIVLVGADNAFPGASLMARSAEGTGGSSEEAARRGEE